MAFNTSPWTAINPSIVIATNTASTPAVSSQLLLQCLANSVSLVPEDSEVDADSFCNPDGTLPGSTTWTSTIPILLTFTDGSSEGSWNVLHSLRRTKQTFILKPNDAAASSANPSATFQAYIPSIPFMDNERGQSARFDLELSVIGDPVFATS